jgi:light-harvesting protein B-800-850 alpha chain
MNQGRIWCVVHPTVGLPLFLGGVATIALLVHASVLTNTDWMSKYWKGKDARAAAMNSTAPVATMLPAAPGFAVSVSPVVGPTGTTSFVVTVIPTTDSAKVASVEETARAEKVAAGPPPIR